MTSSSGPATRQLVAGLVLHRSEVIAHSMDTLERKGDARISRGQRRKGEGFGGFAQPGKPFRPLGAPVELERLKGLVSTKLNEVNYRTTLAQLQNVSSQHNEPKAKRTDADLPGADWAPSADAVDGGLGTGAGQLLGADGAEGADTERSPQQSSLPSGLFGKDLPRCQGRRHVTDGFDLLMRSIRESEGRVQQTKTDSSNGLQLQTSTLEMPVRDSYPPTGPAERRLAARRASYALPLGGISGSRPGTASMPLSARLPGEGSGGAGAGTRLRSPPPALDLRSTGPVAGPGPGPSPGRAPHSARGPARGGAPLSPREPAGGASTITLPAGRAGYRPGQKLTTLADFLASPGAGGGGATSSGMVQTDRSQGVMGYDGSSYKYNKYRDAIDKLLSYGLNLTGSMRDEKPKAKDATGQRKGQEIDRWKRTEKYLEKRERELWDKCPPRVAEATEEMKKGDGELCEEARMTGGAEMERPTAETPQSVAPGEWKEVDDPLEADNRRRKRERVEAEEQIVSAMKSAQDSKESPVAKLRCELLSYQRVRDARRQKLREDLHKKEVNRPNVLRQRIGYGATAEPNSDTDQEERLERQFRWYRDLLVRMQAEKNALPNVVYFIMDTAWAVLEQGIQFEADMFYSVLSQVANYEINRVVASLILYMLRGIEEVSIRDLISWFEHNRGDVPRYIREAAENLDDQGGPEDAEQDEGRRQSGGGTFVTEAP